MPASAITTLEPAMVTLEASTWLRSALARAVQEQPLLLGAHRVADVADGRAGRAGAPPRTMPSALGVLALLDEIQSAWNCVEPGLDRRAAAFLTLST